MVEKFFDGAQNLQRLLLEAVVKEMDKQRLPPQELDRRCLFGWHDLPTYDEFKDKPDLMTAPVFSLACFALSLKADEVLGLKEEHFQKKIRANKNWVLDHMKENKAYLAGAYGAHGKVTAEDLMPLYIMLKSLESIEPQVAPQEVRPPGSD
jgi:hypothetical protein